MLGEDPATGCSVTADHWRRVYADPLVLVVKNNILVWFKVV